jgi:hypothetical protein
LGIGDWGLGPIPNPQSPIPNPQSPMIQFFLNIKYFDISKLSIIFKIIIKYIFIIKIIMAFTLSKNTKGYLSVAGGFLINFVN